MRKVDSYFLADIVVNKQNKDKYDDNNHQNNKKVITDYVTTFYFEIILFISAIYLTDLCSFCRLPEICNRIYQGWGKTKWRNYKNRRNSVQFGVIRYRVFQNRTQSILYMSYGHSGNAPQY